MKKIIIILLSLMLLTPQTIFASDSLYVSLYAAGNLGNEGNLNLYIKDNKAYVSVDDIAYYGGYEIKQKDNDFGFYRSGQLHNIDKKIIVGNQTYVLFDEAIKTLNIEFFLNDRSIYLRGMETTPIELYKICDTALYSTKYRVLDLDNTEGRLAKYGSILYDLLIKGKIFKGDFWSGHYDKSTYEDIFCDIVEHDSFALMDATKEANKINKNISNLSKIIDYAEKDTIEVSDIWNDYYTLKDINEAYSVFTDLPGTLAKEIIKDSYVAEGISGLDLETTLKLLRTMDAVYNRSAFYGDAIHYTFGQQITSNGPFKGLIPNDAEHIIESFELSYTDDEKISMYSRIFHDELSNVFFSTSAKIAKNGIKEIIPAMKIYDIVSWATDLLLEQAEQSPKFDYVHKTDCLSDLQKGLIAMYAYYRNNLNNLINVKYITIMYLECYRLFCDEQTKSKVYDSKALAKYAKDIISQLAVISDRDLTYRCDKTLNVSQIKKYATVVSPVKKAIDSLKALRGNVTINCNESWKSTSKFNDEDFSKEYNYNPKANPSEDKKGAREYTLLYDDFSFMFEKSNYINLRFNIKQNNKILAIHENNDEYYPQDKKLYKNTNYYFFATTYKDFNGLISMLDKGTSYYDENSRTLEVDFNRSYFKKEEKKHQNYPSIVYDHEYYCFYFDNNMVLAKLTVDSACYINGDPFGDYPIYTKYIFKDTYTFSRWGETKLESLSDYNTKGQEVTDYGWGWETALPGNLLGLR